MLDTFSQFPEGQFSSVSASGPEYFSIQKMNSQKHGLRVASTLFALFALGHLLRLLTRADLLVAGHRIPLSLSIIVPVIAAGLSLWIWRLSLEVSERRWRLIV